MVWILMQPMIFTVADQGENASGINDRDGIATTALRSVSPERLVEGVRDTGMGVYGCDQELTTTIQLTKEN